MADYWNQTIQITLSPDAGGVKVPVFLSEIDQNNKTMIIQTIGYGTEIGASVLMLIIILVMTPKTKFWRFSTYLNIAALCNNIIRLILLVIYFESSWVGFYALYSGDDSFVSQTDFNNSIASTVMGIPQNMMIMSALILQAWAMVRFWPQAYKWCIVLVSTALVLLEIGFMVASEAYQIITFHEDEETAYMLIMSTAWVRYAFLGLEVTCICWFCFLFVAKLATHLWKNRSFLPTTKGLGAMDALVMTNGILMLIPLFFAGLQYAEITVLQLGSMVYTSVLIVLPLGCLVAQRIADPSAFNSELSTTARVNQNPNDRFEAYTSKKNGLLNNATWSQSDKDSAVFPGQRGSSNTHTAKNGVTATVTSGNYFSNMTVGHASPAEIELARIDADFGAGQVRVDHEIRQEVL
ncbi:pheromone alpha factor receptor [Gnomoniopsis sp. IMI 355080]|nr:pheromone alpha factor receptor [Gnomoniopsis sp. IMI 355080]